MPIDVTFVRRPRHGFGWIDHRVVSHGLLEKLNRIQVVLYLVLCVVADRHGISWYHPRKLGRLIKYTSESVQEALKSLEQSGLVAVEGRYVQVLDFPEKEDPSRVLTDRPTGPVDIRPATDAGTEKSPSRIRFERLGAVERKALCSRARQELARLMGNQTPGQRSVESLAISYLERTETGER